MSKKNRRVLESLPNDEAKTGFYILHQFDGSEEDNSETVEENEDIPDFFMPGHFCSASCYGGM